MAGHVQPVEVETEFRELDRQAVLDREQLLPTLSELGEKCVARVTDIAVLALQNIDVLPVGQLIHTAMQMIVLYGQLILILGETSVSVELNPLQQTKLRRNLRRKDRRSWKSFSVIKYRMIQMD